jgi:UDP-N-acetylmuramoylalanine-D-glutamate ligase
LSQTLFEILDKNLENEKHILVTECSSFMLWGLKNIEFDYSVRLNFSIDHLNRHKDLQEYFDTKKILLRQTKKVGFVGALLWTNPSGTIVPPSLIREDLGCKIEVYDQDYDISGSKFIGKHNAGNINACYMLVKEYLQDTTDRNEQEIVEKLKNIINQIEPLPHHTTLVKTID